MNVRLLYNMTSTVIGQIAIVIAGVGTPWACSSIHRITRVKL